MIYFNDTRETIIFHYNKAHNTDTTILPWVIKTKGKTFYINHLDILPNIGFSTNETPDNSHTKATLKIKGRLKIEDIDGRFIATIF